jgi:hypothetical protein
MSTEEEFQGLHKKRKFLFILTIPFRKIKGMLQNVYLVSRRVERRKKGDQR